MLCLTSTETKSRWWLSSATGELGGRVWMQQAGTPQHEQQQKQQPAWRGQLAPERCHPDKLPTHPHIHIHPTPPPGVPRLASP